MNKFYIIYFTNYKTFLNYKAKIELPEDVFDDKFADFLHYMYLYLYKLLYYLNVTILVN